MQKIVLPHELCRQYSKSVRELVKTAYMSGLDNLTFFETTKEDEKNSNKKTQIGLLKRKTALKEKVKDNKEPIQKIIRKTFDYNSFLENLKLYENPINWKNLPELEIDPFSGFLHNICLEVLVQKRKVAKEIMQDTHTKDRKEFALNKCKEGILKGKKEEKLRNTYDFFNFCEEAYTENKIERLENFYKKRIVEKYHLFGLEPLKLKNKPKKKEKPDVEYEFSIDILLSSYPLLLNRPKHVYFDLQKKSGLDKSINKEYVQNSKLLKRIQNFLKEYSNEDFGDTYKILNKKLENTEFYIKKAAELVFSLYHPLIKNEIVFEDNFKKNEDWEEEVPKIIARKTEIKNKKKKTEYHLI